jgi:uncharacterized membrane protein (UPF0127 family)
MTSIRVARGPLQRMKGLAWAPPGDPLEIPRCRSVQTFGMRYALDLIWIDADRSVVRIDRDVPPRRMRSCRQARSVIEVEAGRADELLAREGAVVR